MKRTAMILLSLALLVPSFALAEEAGILPAEEAGTLMEGEVFPEGELPEACASEAPTMPEVTPMPTALGENAFQTAGDLFQYWMSLKSFPESPYPDYVTGVWSTDGSADQLTFGVTKNEEGEAGKEEILSYIVDDSTADFTYQSFPHHELMKVQGNLITSMNNETGAYGIGVYDMENRVVISIDVSAPGAEAFMEECFAAYGDRVAFEEGEGIFLTLETGVDRGGDLGELPATGLLQETGLKKPNLLPVMCLAVLLLLCLGALLLLRNRRGRAAVTAQGECITAASVTEGEIKEALREYAAVPSAALDEKILAAAEKEIEGK